MAKARTQVGQRIVDAEGRVVMTGDACQDAWNRMVKDANAFRLPENQKYEWQILFKAGPAEVKSTLYTISQTTAAERALATFDDAVQSAKNIYETTKREFAERFDKNPAETIEWNADAMIKAQVGYQHWMHLKARIDGITTAANKIELCASAETILKDYQTDVTERLLSNHPWAHNSSSAAANMCRSIAAEQDASLVRKDGFGGSIQSILRRFARVRCAELD